MKLTKILSLLTLFGLILSLGSGLFAMDQNGKSNQSQDEQFRRETDAKQARAAEREQEELQAVLEAKFREAAEPIKRANEAERRADAAEQLLATVEKLQVRLQGLKQKQASEEVVPHACECDEISDDEENLQADLKDRVFQQDAKSQRDAKLQDDGKQSSAVNGVSNANPNIKSQQNDQQGWRLFKTIDGLKGPVVARVAGEFMSDMFPQECLLQSLLPDAKKYGAAFPTNCAIKGRFLITGEGDGYLKMWSINPYKCISQINLGSPIYSIATNKTGKLVAVNFTNKNAIIVLDIVKDQQEYNLKLKKILKNDFIKSGSKLSFMMNFMEKNFNRRNKEWVGFTRELETVPEYLVQKHGNEKWIGCAVGNWNNWEDAKAAPHLSHYCVHKVMTFCEPKKLPFFIACFHQDAREGAASLFICGDDSGELEFWNADDTRSIGTERTIDCFKLQTDQKDLTALQSFYTNYTFKGIVGYLMSASSDGTVKIWEHSAHAPLKKCAVCKKDRDAGEVSELRCCPCKKIKYCSSECQKADWKHHKAVCDFKKSQEAVCDFKKSQAKETN